jgi:flavodoxin
MDEHTTIAVRYLSKTGHTKLVADVIAQELSVVAAPLDEPLPDEVAVLFLGGALYGFGLDDELKTYITTLSPANIAKVYVFATSALLTSVNQTIKSLLIAQGLSVADETFHCYGKFAALRSKHPDDADLQAAAAFAKGLVETDSI